MDEIVLRAIAKWPNVPSVYNWLMLDRRGNWLVKGERIANAAVIDFIGRNYAGDAKGRWYFQNGPQRVFVDLAYTPLVYRLHADATGELVASTHTGAQAPALSSAWIDERGDIGLVTALGPGLVIDRDLPLLVDRLRQASGQPLDEAALDEVIDRFESEPPLRLTTGADALAVCYLRSAAAPARFGFDPRPRPAPGEPEC